MKINLHQTRRNSVRRLLLVLTPVVSLFALQSAHAATGTWNLDSGGLWSTPANWSGSVPASAGDTANLTYAITAARVITNDVSRTIGILNLADSLSSAGYTLTNNSGITFTLNNSGAGAQLNQTGGATAADVIATPIILADSFLVTNNSSLKLSGVISGTGFGLSKAGAGTLTCSAGNTFSGAVTVNGGTLLFATGGSINSASGLTINNGGTAQFSGAANGNPIGTGNMPITVNAGGTLAVTVGNAMGYSAQADYANIKLNGGAISLSAVQYINTVVLNGGTVSGTGALQWFYTPASPAVAISCTNTASIATPINFNSVAQTISVSNNATLTISGNIAAAGAVTKAGQGTLTLSGANTYTTATLINAGTLNIGSGGSLSTGAVTVKTNATLTGTGTIGGATTNQAGGTLAIGVPTTGTLTLNNTLMLAAGSTNIMKLNKTGGTLTNDFIQGLTSVTYGGTLIVTNITSDSTALAGGDSVQLFSAGTYAGGFNTLVLPTLPAGLSWDITQLAVTGNLNVSSVVSTPTFNPPAGAYPSPLVVTISSLTAGATIYYTTDGTTPSTSSPHGVTPVTVTIMTSSPSQTVTAYGALTGHANSGANSAAYSSTLSAWTNTAGGNWSDTGSWLYGIPANGSGFIADFSTLTLAGDTSVANDLAPTVGAMVFADRGNSHNWTVADTGAGPITLDNGANPPVITVSNETAIITTPLAGTGGLTKTGNGTLNLLGANTYTGATTDNAGTLGVNSFAVSSSGTLTIASGATVNSFGTLSLNANGSATMIGVSGAGTLQLAATNNNAASPDIYFDANDVQNANSTANYGSRIATPINLGTAQRFIWGNTDHNGVGQYGVTGADCQLAGSISGSGGLTFVAQDAYTSTSPMQVPFCLNASNSFTGPVEIQRGSVYLGAAGAFPAVDVLRFNVASGNTGNFFLYGQNVAVSDLSSTNSGTAVLANGNANPSAYGPVTLTVTQNNPTTFAGTIVDVKSEYGVTSGSAATTLSLFKNGPATLTLAGANTYSGTTTVGAGKLVVSTTQLTTNAITVIDGAALGVIVSGTSQLSPVTLTEGSVSGPTVNEFTGVASTSTAPVKAGNLNLNGTTTINILSGTFVAGNTYPLIAFASIGGTGKLVIGTLPANVVANVITNGNSIALNVTSGSLLTWNGLVNGAWDIATTANWTLNGVSGNTYADGAPVVFDDTAAGPTTVNAAVTVSPASITVNNTGKIYTIGGSPIAGSTALTKNGTNSLTLTGANAFTGNLAIGAGTVTIGGAGVLGGGLYAGAITNSGQLIYNSTTDQTNAGAISGPGNLVQNGPDTLTLSANNPMTGGIAVNGGSLVFTTGGAINNASGLTINNGGTVQFSGAANGNPIGTNNMPITVNTGGTLAVTVGNAMGYSVQADYANITLNSGTISLSAVQYINTLLLNGGTVSGTAALQFWYPVSTAINCSNTATISSPINFNNSGQTISVSNNAILTISGVIIAAGTGVTKAGLGTLILSGGNTYTNPFTINAGMLNLAGGASLGTGAVTIMTNATLTGTGTIGAATTNQAGGTLAIGAPTTGTLTIYNSLTLAAGSTNLMNISKTGGTLTSDSIQGLSSVIYGGTLIVTNVTSDSTALADGDTVQLFSAGSYAGGFSTLILPVLPAGLSWDASQLAISGSLAMVSAVATPTFNPPAGSYPGPVAVTISSLTPGATIYYTTDGSTPTTGSPHGVTPVTITVLASSPGETLTAYGALAGYADSALNSAAYALSSSFWTNTAGGNWSDTGSWLYAVVANASGITADFSTLTLAGDTSVTNDLAPTVGGMVFADRGNAHNWMVADIGVGPITLDNGANSPVITVSNQTATIATPLTGTGGLTKNGNGILVLTGANTYTGTTKVGAGTLSLWNTVDIYAASPLVITAGAVASSAGTLNLDVNQNGSGPSVNVSGAGTLRLTGTNNNASSPDLYFAPDQVGIDYYGATEAAALDLGGLQRFVYGLTGHNGVGEYGLANADCVFTGSIRGSGGLTIIAQNSYTGSSPMEVPFCLLASNSFAGTLEIQRGSVYLGNANALTQTNVLFLNAGSGNNARFFLYGNSVAVANLSSSSTGANVIANGNELSTATLTLGAVTLTVNQNAPGTYSGSIQDVQAEYDGSGSGTTGPLSLLKTGTNTLTLSSGNTYSGATTVGGGTLLVSGSLGSGAVTVSAGATLTGAGAIGGATTVQSGGTLAPGNNGLGSLSLNNALTLAAGSSTALAIDRRSGTATYGNVAGLTRATFGGTLTVTSLGGTFQAGDSFQLFSSGSSSNFTATNLPAISPLKWNWNPAAGLLSVVSAVNTTPTNVIAVVSGGALNLSWPADHIGWRLLVQTNHLAAGISANINDWSTVSGSAATNQESIPIDATKPTEFYRLAYP